MMNIKNDTVGTKGLNKSTIILILVMYASNGFIRFLIEVSKVIL